MTPLSDKAIALANDGLLVKDNRPSAESLSKAFYETLIGREDYEAVCRFNRKVIARARELDAASRGEDEARVERVARAMCESELDPAYFPWDSMPKKHKELWIDRAHAALAAKGGG